MMVMVVVVHFLDFVDRNVDRDVHFLNVVMVVSVHLVWNMNHMVFTRIIIIIGIKIKDRNGNNENHYAYCLGLKKRGDADA